MRWKQLRKAATAATQQNDGIIQITTAVNEMDKVTQENAASAEESASASGRLNAQAEMLKETVITLSMLVEKQSVQNVQSTEPIKSSTTKSHQSKLSLAPN
jgi:methyl-accepting chemotaxis protein